jgi:hypothetical protein
VRWHRNSIFFCALAVFKFFFESFACSLEAVSVVVQAIPKLFVQSTKVSSLQGANKLAGNEEGIKEVLKRRD